MPEITKEKPFNLANLYIENNPHTNGLCCFFHSRGKDYYASIINLELLGTTECMIFNAKGRQVHEWRDLYCKHGLPLCEESLKGCVREFLEAWDEREVIDG